MAKTPIPGIPMLDTIVPEYVEDPHATHDAWYGRGGLREVDTATSSNPIARSINNIPTPRLSVGMIVTASDTRIQYQYTGNMGDIIVLNNITLNGWIVYNNGGGGGLPLATANDDMLVTGVWYKAYTFFRLQFNGTGTAVLNVQDNLGNSTNNYNAYAFNNSINTIKTFIGENTVAYMLTFPSTLTVRFLN